LPLVAKVHEMKRESIVLQIIKNLMSKTFPNISIYLFVERRELHNVKSIVHVHHKECKYIRDQCGFFQLSNFHHDERVRRKVARHLLDFQPKQRQPGHVHLTMQPK
jgi:hypothetical protein